MTVENHLFISFIQPHVLSLYYVSGIMLIQLLGEHLPHLITKLNEIKKPKLSKTMKFSVQERKHLDVFCYISLLQIWKTERFNSKPGGTKTKMVWWFLFWPVSDPKPQAV